ncbi:NAD(P)H-hydrate dehydratase [Eubacterium oxidoreducens]|uniref:Bifunctional NAD(P)H-hydrate repair enzyme n=1 Tax=Eubacterium oxidoreducens TaxID=1732 RepID=A0A1G6AKX4_EUBOX|nr:NAD(P)H-hydrate dehydratase [Eubacterium oxidoreducens]SDB09064.1 NAD(P)H-hydrate epimerase [Eubacterium oxidoreducens]
MKKILNAASMQQCDRTTIDFYKMPSLVLMERAALEMYRVLEEKIRHDDNCCIVCGSGNNGGDGIALARLLHLAGYRVQILFAGNLEHMSIDCKKQMDIAKQYQVPCCFKDKTDLDNLLKKQDVIVDAIFGVGLCRRIEGDYCDLIERMNQINAYKVALDISSGISADDGQIMGTAFMADLTITVGYEKVGQHLYPGVDYTGELVCCEIGINDYSFLEHKPTAFILEKTDLTEIPKRKSSSNKGTYGKVLVIAGKQNMGGAAYFAAAAAYKTGCGLVKVFTEESNRQIVQTLIPEAILETYEEQRFRVELLKKSILWASVIICGPGLGTETVAGQIMEEVLKEKTKPVIIDADGLNILATMSQLKLGANFVLTPHIGEMSRLCKKSVSDIKKDPIKIATEYARNLNCNLVMKDARSIIVDVKQKVYINESGNSGMSTGGSGDVLSGIIGGLCAINMPPAKACAFGPYLHGLAGTNAVKIKNEYSLMASDLLEGLCVSMNEIE